MPVDVDERGFLAVRAYGVKDRWWSGVTRVPGGAGRLTMYWEDSKPLWAWQFSSVHAAIEYQRRFPLMLSNQPSISMDRAAERSWRWDAEQGGWVERDIKRRR